MAKVKTETKGQPVLDAAIADIEKRFGPNSIVRLNSNTVVQVDTIPTGILPLDLALGIDGLPRGRFVEIYGPESSGKTTIALMAIAEAQRLGLTAAFIDVEHALDAVYAQNVLGVNLDELLVAQPDNAEEALEIALSLTGTGEVGVIVIDSVSALVPRAEADGDMGDANVGLQARLMGQALRKLTPITSKSNTLFIFINQLRDLVGVMGYGPKTITSGGKALKFYASIRLEVRRISTDKDKEGDATSNRTRVKVAKNKLASPYKEAEFDLVFGKGVPKENCLIDVGVECGVIKKSGAYFSWDGENLGQGKAKAAAHLAENPTTYYEILALIKEKTNGLDNGPEIVYGEEV